MANTYSTVKEWRDKNPNKLKEQKARYRTKNKEKIQNYWKEWYQRKKKREIETTLVEQ